MQHPLTYAQQGPHLACGTHTFRCPGRTECCCSGRQRARRKEAVLARSLPEGEADADGQSARKGHVQVSGHRAPTAPAPKRAHLTLHLPGTAIGGHLLPAPGLTPRPLHHRWADMGCDNRLGAEAVSTGPATGGQRAQNRAHHSLLPGRSCHPTGRPLWALWVGLE